MAPNSVSFNVHSTFQMITGQSDINPKTFVEFYKRNTQITVKYLVDLSLIIT